LQNNLGGTEKGGVSKRGKKRRSAYAPGERKKGGPTRRLGRKGRSVVLLRVTLWFYSVKRKRSGVPDGKEGEPALSDPSKEKRRGGTLRRKRKKRNGILHALV